jgi:hypothetical protein
LFDEEGKVLSFFSETFAASEMHLVLPLLLADRNSTAANETLNSLLDLQDYLEDIPAPGPSSQRLRRCIFFLSIWKLQKLTELQKELHRQFLSTHRAPMVDLDW